MFRCRGLREWRSAVHVLATPWGGVAVVFAVSSLGICLLVGGDVLFHLGRAAVGVNPSADYQYMTWSLRWWPWAVAHGLDPLQTHLFWPPQGFSTLWMTTIPVPALLAAPITLTAGPLVAYNILMLLAVPLASVGAFLLSRELTGRFWPSLFAGVLFGFSPYMLGHTLSDHLDLTFIFPVPLLALLVVRRLRGRTGARRFAAGFALLLLVQLGSSFELFLDLSLLVAIGAVLALVGTRRRALPTVKLVAVSYVLCLPVLVPIAILAFSTAHAPLRYSPTNFATDLFNLVIPTPTVAAGRLRALRAVSEHFVSNIGEQDGYLGIPLLVVAVLAVRAEWRRGGWFIGGLLLTAVLLAFGPILSVGGRPLLRLPFAIARLPVLAGALPARLSLFVSLAAVCLCALWLARPGRAPLRTAVAVIVALSLIPNFWASSRLSGAWAISNAFGWSIPRVSAGFVSVPGWQRLVRPGSTVLVLPTGALTAASYWQSQAGMRFVLAVPATPFAPPDVAASPTIAGLVNNDLPSLTGLAVAAGRLRAYLIADHVAAVIVTSATGERWRQVVATATGTSPVALGDAQVYSVPTTLRPLRARGRVLFARTRVGATDVSSRPSAPRLAVWVAFDGSQAHVFARLEPARKAVMLSSARGDALLPAAAIDNRPAAAVAFVEWRDRHDLLRVATRTGKTWRVATLDRSTEPIWATRVVILPDGTTVAAWIDERDPVRSIRAAQLPPNGHWSRALTLETVADIGSLALAAGSNDEAVAAWTDAVVSERRVRATTLTDRHWSSPSTLANSLDNLGFVHIQGPDANLIKWQKGWGTLRHRSYTAHRAGTSWVDLDRTPVS